MSRILFLIAAGLLVVASLSGMSDLGVNAARAQSQNENSSVSNKENPFNSPDNRVELYKVGDGQYPAQDVLAQFLTAVLPYQNAYEENSALLEFGYRPDGRFLEALERYPWLSEYIYRSKGIPNSSGIVKRQGEIIVSTGFPPAMSENRGGLDIQWPDSDGNPVVEDLVKNTVLGLSDQISDMTALPVRYVDPGESGAGDASLRIVYVQDIDSWETIYKKNNSSTERDRRDISLPYRPDIENLIDTKISFTPTDDNHVDGYILADENNVIGMSFCFIWEGHHETMIRALVTECMLRSLGVAYKIKDESSFLGNWNAVYNDKALDNRPPLARWKNFSGLSPEQKSKLIEANTKTEMIPDQVSAWDRFIISLLYNPAIKPGDHHTAIKYRHKDLLP